MKLNLKRVRENVRVATTEDLLDRVTVYRAGMEAAALDIIEDELRQRGISPGDVEAHQEGRLRETAILPDGTAVRCTFCYRPAIAEGWGWHRMWGRVPLFPRFYHYCADHLPAGRRSESPEEPDEGSFRP
ncbi:MAG TPA: hypothetical protein VK395_23655 [Gemmataceae bacterium]|nr:hypothetical protein [Gemmataceae bacterium]